MPNELERREYGLLELKAAAEPGTFSGYGAVFGNVDSYGEVIERGAFKKSLSEWEARGKYPKMLLQHGGWGLGSEDMMPVGQWTSMSEDSRGLKVDGRLFALNTDRGQYIYDGLKSGELDSLSIGFQTVNSRSEIVQEEEIRFLTEIKLWEVSIVTFPANDKALIGSVRSMTNEELRDLEDALGERGLSRSDRLKAVAVFKEWRRREAGVPSSTPRDEDVSEAAAVTAAAEALAAKFAAGCLKF
jgi:HK97 family phage prohead protease